MLSYFRRTPLDIACLAVIDDCTPGWTDAHEAEIRSWCPEGARVRIVHLPKNEQLTYAWNYGLRTTPPDMTYSIVGNNDVLFTDGWHLPLIRAVEEEGYHLVGPVSNAPGVTSQPKSGPNPAYVGALMADYPRTDLNEERERIAAYLRERYAGVIVPTKINGFFQFGKFADFAKGRYDDRHVYKPRNDFMPSGRKNKTPLFTGNEDEIQHRWAKMGRRFGVCQDSYIFHYRSAFRGPKFRKGDWVEMTADDFDRLA